MICITSHKRPDMLLALLKELDGIIHVFDDCSEYDYTEHEQYCTYHRSGRWRGKLYFWKQWNWMLDVCRRSNDNLFLFTQDDVQNIDLDAIHEIVSALEGKFAFNIMNVGEDRGWTPQKTVESDMEGLLRVGYVDCNFVTNRQTLDAIGWELEPISIRRFIMPNISSGVGQQLSENLFQSNIPMYMPEKSLAYHGDHKSLMHEQEREQNPLISR